jgi:hypothetical protein
MPFTPAPAKAKQRKEKKRKEKKRKDKLSRFKYGKIFQDSVFTHCVRSTLLGTTHRPIYDCCRAANICFA